MNRIGALGATYLFYPQLFESHYTGRTIKPKKASLTLLAKRKKQAQQKRARKITKGVSR